MTNQPGFNQPVAPFVPGTTPLDADERRDGDVAGPFDGSLDGATANGAPDPEENEPSVLVPPNVRDADSSHLRGEPDDYDHDDSTDRLLGDDRVVDLDDER